MLIIKNTNTDAYFNLAAEEYLLKSKREDIFMAWRNANAVIIGRNQDAEREVDAETAAALNVRVVRRLTGGGAVYHDLGNVNYTFIRRGADGHFNDYPYFAAPMIAFLKKQGITAEFSGRNDILVSGSKISGTAQVKNGADVLFHGTLLIDTDMTVLGKVLKPDYEKLERHAIQSVRSRVTNLKELLPVGVDALTVMDLLCGEFLSVSGAVKYDLTQQDLAAIDRLREDKYSAHEWNYGGQE
ncbi:hypothetical protein FACS1894211_12000 [Clostridia bacterium]|nr:hypothetical protein FACS1894211_12000 [Clostridia bacterium]